MIKVIMETFAAPRDRSAWPERRSTVKPTVGVLALQGDFEAHAHALRNAGASTTLVRTAADLDGLDGLAIPGGESTTMLKVLERGGFFEALREFLRFTPCFATCAGCILLAREVLSPGQSSLGLLDITVERNAYGRQIDSAILTEETELPGGPLETVFIRAPRITRAGANVQVLALREGNPTLVRQGHLLAATFHPEMTADSRVQSLFLEMVCAYKFAGRRANRKRSRFAIGKNQSRSKQKDDRAVARVGREFISAN
jgi:pyridoxal 5'-phosphate synthase pdxT subunit